MSTKTSIKRVALVAAAALTLGGFVAVSSANASTYPGLKASTTTGANSVTVSSYSVTDTTSVSATVGTYVLETVTANAADSVYNITTTGGSISIASAVAPFLAEDRADSTTAGYSVNGNTIQWYTGAGAGLGGAFSGSATLTFAVYSATAGTQTLTVAGNVSTAVTQTITWGAAPAVSAANSKSVLVNVAGSASPATDSGTAVPYLVSGAGDSTTALATTASTKAAMILVQLYNNQPSAAPISGDSLTAVVSGNGLVSGSNGTDALTSYSSFSVSATSTTDGNGYALFGVSSNGGSGTATISVSYTDANGVTTVIATKTVTFYSSTIASIKATVNHAYIPLAPVAGYVYAGNATDVSNASLNSGAYSTTVLPAVSVVAKDANGNAIPSASINVTSSNPAVAAVSATAAWQASPLGYYVPTITPVSEGTTTLTFSDALTGLITGTAVINVSKAVIASVATATDANSYDAATAVKYTITAKDAAGNPVPDGNYIGFYVGGYEPSPNVALQNQSNITSDTLTTVSGVEATSFYAPVTPGTTVTITGGTLPGTAGSSTAGIAFIASALNASTQGGVSFTVNGGSDASGATDAANAATDAANAAADAADNATQAASEALAAVNSLATTVASLIAGIKAQITSLTNLITKIKNKVGA